MTIAFEVEERIARSPQVVWERLTAPLAAGPHSVVPVAPMQWITPLCVALALIALPDTARAATLLTDSFLPLQTDQYAFCTASNPSATKAVTVEVQMLGDDGTPGVSATLEIAPLGTASIGDEDFLGLDRRCRFTFKGGRRRVLGSLAAYQGTFAAGRILVVLEAR